MTQPARKSGRKRRAVEQSSREGVLQSDENDIRPTDVTLPRRRTAARTAAAVAAAAVVNQTTNGVDLEANALSKAPLVRLLDTIMLQSAVDSLSKVDQGLAALAVEHGLPDKLLKKEGNCFQSLARSIVYQQLAGKAADTIYSRVLACCQCDDPLQLEPSMILSTNEEALRSAGLSQRKLSYLLDLASHFSTGLLDDDMIVAMEHAELKAKLLKIKGIGPWTIDMFAMFHLGHPDILPVGDLGVRKGMQVMFNLKALPSPTEMEKLTEHWRPYRSIGSYYMWRITTKKNVERTVDL